VTALGFDAFASIELTVRDAPGGSVLFNGETTADTYGYTSWRSYDIGIPDGFWPGFEFTVTDSVQTRVLVVSNIHIQRIDVDAGIVEGIAPPNSLVKLDILRDPLKPWVTTADPSGHWSFDFGATSTIGWTASLVAETTDADGDRTTFYARPPYIYATFPTYVRAYYFLAAASANIQIFDEPGGTLIGAASGGTSEKSGSVTFYIPALGFELESGMLVRVTDGTHTKELIVDGLTIDSLDLDADTLGGSAPPGTTLRVNLTSRETWLYLQTTADGTGRWSLDVAGELDLGAQHFIQVSSIDAENDFTYVWREPPFLYELTLDQGTLTPTFDRETTSYATGVGNSVETITLTASVWTATVTINGEPSGWDTPVEVDLAVGANPIEIVATHTDGLSVITYNLTVTRAAPSLPPPVIILTPPRLTPTLVVTNDDGGTATAEDFTVLLDDEPIEVGTTIIISSGAHTIAVGEANPFYDVEFSAVCSDGTFSAVPGSLVNCTITLDDLPLTAVLGAPLPGAVALIDESLSLIDDAFNLNGQTVVQASSAGAPPEIIVTVPVEALPGDGDITVSVLPANELAIGETPPAGTVLIGGTAYVISITDADGQPVTSFQLPITLSFAVPEGTDVTPLAAYVFDDASGLWVVQPGAIVEGRYVVTPTHLTTYGLFQFQGDGGFANTLPASGTALSVAEGGTFLQLEQALLHAEATSVFIAEAGALIGYVPGAPDFVNEDFVELLGGVIPPGQLLIVVLGS
jgi:cadherin-like protein